MTKYTRQRKTEQTGAFFMLNNETHLNDINTIRQGKNWFTEHMGRKTTTTTVLGRDITLPLPEGASRAVTILPGRGERADKSPGRWWRREEPGRRHEGAGTGGAWQDPGHFRYGCPWWSRRREEPWRRNGRRLQRGDQLWWSRRRRSPRWSWWVNGPRRSPGLGGWRQSRGKLRPCIALEDGSPAELAPHWWWAEGEQRGCQTTVEEAGAGGCGGNFRGAGTGWHFRGAGTGGSKAPSGLDKGIKDEGGLDRTSGGEGERRGGSSISRAASQSIRSHSMSSSPRCINSSPSAMVQGAELHSVLTTSWRALLPVHTPWLHSSVAGTPAVGSGMRSTNRGDGGLISYFVSHSWGIPMMKITGLSHLFKWENLHNLWLTKYFFAPLYIY